MAQTLQFRGLYIQSSWVRRILRTLHDAVENWDPTLTKRQVLIRCGAVTITEQYHVASLLQDLEEAQQIYQEDQRYSVCKTNTMQLERPV